MTKGPLPISECARRRKISMRNREKARAEYLKQQREQAEFGFAIFKLCEAMGWPIVFRKADLIALRK